MTLVFIADAQRDERSALDLVLNDLKLEVVGQAGDWETTLQQAPQSGAEMVLVDWDLLPSLAFQSLRELREACRPGVSIVLISRWTARQQAAIASGADIFVSKADNAARVAESLRNTAAGLRAGP